jgi:hypothetical protein
MAPAGLSMRTIRLYTVSNGQSFGPRSSRMAARRERGVSRRRSRRS